jgi:hypothetical protein
MMRALVWLCLSFALSGVAMVAGAQGARPVDLGEDLRANLVTKPSLDQVVRAFLRSGLDDVEITAILDYDEHGTIIAATLSASSGDVALDDAIVDWCKRARLGAGAAGRGRLPFFLVNEEGERLDGAKADGKSGR